MTCHRIGYPCVNRSIGCSSSSAFRLANWSSQRFCATVEKNIACLYDIIKYNIRNRLLYTRISSDVIPFASHPVCTVEWQKEFASELKTLGNLIKHHSMRICMHPDQFVVLNSPRPEVVTASIAELDYHDRFLSTLGLGRQAKIQIHGGGIYGDKPGAMARFLKVYQSLSPALRARLVIENDDRSYSVRDCLEIHAHTGIPLLFDWFHHQCLSSGEPAWEAMHQAGLTWRRRDGRPLVDYSSQKQEGRRGSHTESIDIDDFKTFISKTSHLDFDCMLEIKDKEKSALIARDLLGIY